MVTTVEAQPVEKERRLLGLRVILVIAAIFVIISGLRAAHTVLVPFILAVFLAVLSAPLLRLFRRKRIPVGLAVVSVVLIDLAAIAAIVMLIGSSASEFSAALPTYRERLDVVIGDAVRFLNDNGLKVRRSALEGTMHPNSIVGTLAGSLQGVASTFADLILVLLMMVFILLEAATFEGKLHHAMGNPHRFLERFTVIASEVQRYLAYKTGLNLLTGVSLGLLCWAFGVDFPVLWGLVAFLLNYIPNIGSLLATIPPVALALLVHGPGRAILVLLAYITTNTLLGNVLEPMVLGRRLGLSPLVVFVSLILWGWIWGPVGMLLSVPLTMIIKISLENSERYGYIAMLLDSQPVAPKILPAKEKRGPRKL